MEVKKNTCIYGFEDYNVITLNESCLYYNWGEYYIPYTFDKYNRTYIINKDLPVKVFNTTHAKYNWLNQVWFNPNICIDHKELLDIAKKVYTHPNCNLSRTMMAEKYKKSLNPFLSDAVIVPKPNNDELSLDKTALFINEQNKVIVRIAIRDEDAEKAIKAAKEGDKLESLTAPRSPDYKSYSPFSLESITQAELFYYGEVLCVPGSQSYIAELLTNSLPADKIVFEETVQESLGTENNKIDFDSLCNIRDMLDSSDENTVGVGIKVLSVMDWMHYPNSVRFILKECSCNWRGNKASNSTSVKYMLNSLCENSRKTRRFWPGNYDNTIYEKDYELFKQLKMYYDKVEPDKIMRFMKYYSFCGVTPEGMICPNIRKPS